MVMVQLHFEYTTLSETTGGGGRAIAKEIATMLLVIL